MISLTLVTVLTIVGQFQITAKGLSAVQRTISPCFGSPCENNGQCYIAEKGYYCQCPEGYSGKHCENLVLDLKCTDSEPHQCPLWAKKGECFKNPRWMLKNCVKSCRVGACGCTEEDKNCAVWAKQGECDRNREYMIRFCRRSCGGCKKIREPGVFQ